MEELSFSMSDSRSCSFNHIPGDLGREPVSAPGYYGSLLEGQRWGFYVVGLEILNLHCRFYLSLYLP